MLQCKSRSHNRSGIQNTLIKWQQRQKTLKSFYWNQFKSNRRFWSEGGFYEFGSIGLHCAYTVHFCHPFAFLGSCLKHLEHNTPKLHQRWKTHPGLEMTHPPVLPFCPLIKFHRFAFTDLCCFTFAPFAILVDLLELTAMLMRQLKFLALAGLRGDQFCPLASGGGSQHSLLPAKAP